MHNKNLNSLIKLVLTCLIKTMHYICVIGVYDHANIFDGAFLVKQMLDRVLNTPLPT